MRISYKRYGASALASIMSFLGAISLYLGVAFLGVIIVCSAHSIPWEASVLAEATIQRAIWT